MAPRPKYCTKCGDKRTERPSGICLPCERVDRPPERRWRACDICGETTTSKSGTHPACRLAESDPNADDIALPAGDWRFDPFRRVQVYVLRPEPELGPPSPNAVPCAGCEKSFEPLNRRHKYCTRRCRKRADWARRSERYNQERNKIRALARQEAAA